MSTIQHPGEYLLFKGLVNSFFSTIRNNNETTTLENGWINVKSGRTAPEARATPSRDRLTTEPKGRMVNHQIDPKLLNGQTAWNGGAFIFADRREVAGFVCGGVKSSFS